MAHGIVVWLCATHRNEGFLTRRSGREFTGRLAGAWVAGGGLTVRKRLALVSHVRAVELAEVDRDKPGSYSWPLLRLEAERRFAAGEPPAQVIEELRRTYRDGPSMVPSVRTMRRWFTQARWRDTPSRRGRVRLTNPPAGERSPWQPLVNMITTGYGYPKPPIPPGKSRDP